MSKNTYCEPIYINKNQTNQTLITFGVLTNLIPQQQLSSQKLVLTFLLTHSVRNEMRWDEMKMILFLRRLQGMITWSPKERGSWNQQQTQFTYDAESGNQTRVTVVKGFWHTLWKTFHCCPDRRWPVYDMIYVLKLIIMHYVKITAVDYIFFERIC
jgi:hypothetical protein